MHNMLLYKPYSTSPTEGITIQPKGIRLNITTTNQILEFIGFDTRCEIPIFPGFCKEIDLGKMGDTELQREYRRALARMEACNYKLDYIESLKNVTPAAAIRLAA